jgi:hypothetical protein
VVDRPLPCGHRLRRGTRQGAADRVGGPGKGGGLGDVGQPDQGAPEEIAQPVPLVRLGRQEDQRLGPGGVQDRGVGGPLRPGPRIESGQGRGAVDDREAGVVAEATLEASPGRGVGVELVEEVGERRRDLLRRQEQAGG